MKPEFFIDSKIAKKSPLARLLFQGLWVHADRAGRLEKDNDRLKIQILPYDKISIEKLLQELAPDHINFYEIDTKVYIQIKNFQKHQRPHPKEPDSEIPPQPKTEAVKRNGKTKPSREKDMPSKESKGREGVSLMEVGKEEHIVASATKSAKAPKDPDGSFRRCVDHLISTWVFNGAKYPFGEIDGKNIKWLLANYGEAKTKAIMDVFWTGCEGWTLENMGRTTKALRHDLAKILDSEDVSRIERNYLATEAQVVEVLPVPTVTLKSI